MAGHIFELHGLCINFMLISILLHHISLLLYKNGFKLFTYLTRPLGRDAMFILWLCMPLGTLYHILGGTDPLHPSFRSLGLLDKSKRLCSAFESLQGVVPALCLRLGSRSCHRWCFSSNELLRGSGTHHCTFVHVVASTWRAFPTDARLASSHSFSSLVVQGCPVWSPPCSRGPGLPSPLCASPQHTAPPSDHLSVCLP